MWNMSPLRRPGPNLKCLLHLHPIPMRSKLIFFLFLLIMLNACSLKLEMTLFNNLEERVVIRLGKKSVILPPGKSIDFDYPGEQENGLIQLEIANCIYVFQAPQSLEHYPWSTDSRTSVKAQIERKNNLGIFLLPPVASEIVDTSSLSHLQKDGFPLFPTSKTCALI